MRWFVCLVLAGCATPTNELYRELDTCLKNGEICEELQAEIDKRHMAIEQREYDRKSRCPDGYIEYCNYLMRGCGERHKSEKDEYLCITPGYLREAFKDLWP